MDDKLLKPYNPKETEERIYAAWEKGGFFKPEINEDPEAEYFSIVLPPPNVTGVLHIGHAFEHTLQDILIRHARMSGKKTLWVPGTDSAAIATQAKVEKKIKKEEKASRHDIGREELVKRVEKYAKDSENTILSQVRKLGDSLDWSRYAYTLDEKRTKAVTTAFVNMYNAGLIYRGFRTVNWDPKGQTTISDDEIEYVEKKGKFYEFKYGPFIIGTARPETKFGDKYIVMHPDDKRYEKYKHGDTLPVEWINGEITATIIKDTAADPEFGTGVMTITPWHSGIDFEIAERHNLDKEQIIDSYGKLLPVAKEFEGMKISDAREKIVEKLDKKGLLVKVDDNYIHNIGTADRTNGIIEPQIMEQWFIGVDKEFKIEKSTIPNIKSGSKTTLKKVMMESVTSGAVTIEPERFSRSYKHWVKNLHDWCISRQIWFGHRIPVWYKNNEVFCGTEAPNGEGWEQDPDVLDTWFSSALWTFSTLGWPEKTEDLKKFHPTTVMSPAYEILYLWVSRMILMSGFHLGEVPFKHAIIHGLVRDKHGDKFSKSLDNTVDPLEIIDGYGADALRMGLIVGTGLGSDAKYDEQKVKGYKHFANKIWNVARFVLTHTEGFDSSKEPKLTKEDSKHIKELRELVTDITSDINTYKLHLASEKLYHYFWHTFADKIIEEAKAVLSDENEEEKTSKKYTLLYILKTCLKLLHPFMPFITEEVWGTLPEQKGMLIIEPWPEDK